MSFRHAVREAELMKATQGSVQAHPPVLGVDGSGFLSIAMMKHWPKAAWEGKGLSGLTFPRQNPSVREFRAGT